MLGYLTIGFGYFGAMAGIFIYTFLCVQALIYKGVMIHGNLQITDDILEKIYKQIMPSFGLSMFGLIGILMKKYPQAGAGEFRGCIKAAP